MEGNNVSASQEISLISYSTTAQYPQLRTSFR